MRGSGKSQNVESWRVSIAIFLTLQAHPGLRIAELARLTGISRDSLHHRISTMDNQGYFLMENDEQQLYTVHQQPSIRLPDSLIDRLMQLATDIDTKYWDLGDIAEAVLTEFRPYFKVSAIIAELCKWTQWQPETLRDQIRMSHMIPKHKRLEYSALSRHALRACLGAGAEWEKYAQRALESADTYGGRMPPVSVIRGWVKGSTDAQIEAWKRHIEEILEHVEDLSKDPNAPEDLRLLMVEIRGSVSVWSKIPLD